MNEEIILIGGGGHCRSCIDVIEAGGGYMIAGIIDVQQKVGESVIGYEIIGADDDVAGLSKKIKNFLITVGQIKSPDIRISIYERLKKLNANLPVIISPLSYVSKHAVIGEGTIIMHGVIVNAGAMIGKNCIINTRALIEHDAVIEDHCHISTGAVINGGTVVRCSTFIGSGSVTKEYTETKERDIIKANSFFKGHDVR